MVVAKGPGRVTQVSFRRAGIRSRRVFVETVPGQIWTLPGAYDPVRVLRRVIEVGQVDLAHWEKDEI